MKILYSALTEHFWMHITEVVNNMAELGHEMHVAGFLRSRPERLHPSVIFHNITLRNRGWREFCDPVFWQELLRWGRKRLSLGSIIGSFHECWLEDIMDTVRFDLVYERNCFLNPAIALANRQGIPSILEFNGFWPLESEWKGYPADQVRRFLKQEVSAARQATRVICVGRGARDCYVAHGVDKGKTHVIPNGANPDLFRPMDKQHCRKQLGLRLNEKIIGFSGSLQIFYEIDNVIRAMELILKQVHSARIIIVGREYPPPFGPGRSALRSLAKQLGVADRVDFLDVVPYEEIPYYINSFDLCILPLIERSEWQAALSPLKLREYLACGQPVVASDVNGDLQILKEYNAGFLYKQGDAQDFMEKVCNILNNPALALQMGNNARRYVLEHGTWQHATSKILNIAEEITTSPAKKSSVKTEKIPVVQK